MTNFIYCAIWEDRGTSMESVLTADQTIFSCRGDIPDKPRCSGSNTALVYSELASFQTECSFSKYQILSYNTMCQCHAQVTCESSALQYCFWQVPGRAGLLLNNASAQIRLGSIGPVCSSHKWTLSFCSRVNSLQTSIFSHLSEIIHGHGCPRSSQTSYARDRFITMSNHLPQPGNHKPYQNACVRSLIHILVMFV
jgi:hypothetical protein